MKKPSIQFLYVTFPNMSEAKKISQSLVKQKLIACANILPKMTSIYMWNDKLETSSECVAILKTSKSMTKKVENYILKKHSYKTPCVANIQIQKLNKSYMSWLLDCIE